MEVSHKWDHKEAFEELCKKTRFAYFFKHGDKLAPGDYQYPHLVHSQDVKGIRSTVLEWDDGVMYRGDSVTGHEFINASNSDFSIQIYLDAKECISEYLNLINRPIS